MSRTQVSCPCPRACRISGRMASCQAGVRSSWRLKSDKLCLQCGSGGQCWPPSGALHGYNHIMTQIYHCFTPQFSVYMNVTRAFRSIVVFEYIFS